MNSPLLHITVNTLPEKKLVGHCLQMSFTENKTFMLWNQFMPRRKEIIHHLNDELISVEVFDTSYDFRTFNPDLTFEKWASIEVSGFDNLPEGMKTLTIPEGLYASFTFRGTPETYPPVFRYFMESWLPGSGYEMDMARPFLQVMGEKYKRNEPASEEEIYLPVKK